MIEIPCDALNPELLTELVREFVLREGTDYGHLEVSFEQKIAQVKRQLESGRAVVVFNAEDESFDIVRSGS